MASTSRCVRLAGVACTVDGDRAGLERDESSEQTRAKKSLPLKTFLSLTFVLVWLLLIARWLMGAHFFALDGIERKIDRLADLQIL